MYICEVQLSEFRGHLIFVYYKVHVLFGTSHKCVDGVLIFKYPCKQISLY